MTLGHQRRFRRGLLKRIARRGATPDTGSIATDQTTREIERYLTSPGVQSAVRYEVWSRNHGAEEAALRWEAAQQAPMVPFDYRRIRSQPITFYNKPRSTSGVRKICALPDTLKMWHVMAHDLITAQHQPRSHIGDWHGRGRDAQIDQIREALISSRQGVVCADIRHAFASVNFDAVYDLPYLPEALIRRAIDYRSHSFIRRERSEHVRDLSRAACNNVHDDVHGVLERSPSGLMEGSPASNAIFSVLLDDLPDHVGEGIQAFVYCDNIILIAPTVSCAQRAEEALVRYLSGHRAGPFVIRSTVTPVHQHFDHLGYSIQWRGNSRLDVGLSLTASNKLGARLEDEQLDLRETAAWLFGSYGKCSPQMMAGYIQRIVDEAGFRSQRR